jgi:hypothetical protein
MTTSRWPSSESPADLQVLGRVSRCEGQEHSAMRPKAMAQRRWEAVFVHDRTAMRCAICRGNSAHRTSKR